MIYIIDTDTALYDELIRKVPQGSIALSHECVVCDYMLINADNCRSLDPVGNFGIILMSCDTTRLCDRYAQDADGIFTSIDSICARLTNKGVWESEYFIRTRSRAELLLRYIGMDEKLCGFAYIAFMTAYMTYAPKASVKYNIMPVMSTVFSKSAQSIERDMRYAADITWMRGNFTAQQELFGYSINPERGKPVMRELVCMLSEVLREQSDISEIWNDG